MGVGRDVRHGGRESKVWEVETLSGGWVCVSFSVKVIDGVKRINLYWPQQDLRVQR